MTYKTDLLDKLEDICEEAEQEVKLKHSFYKPILDKDGMLKDILIDRVKLLDLLKGHGIYRYDLGVDSYCFILVTDKKVKQVSITYITDWWFNYLKQLPDYTWTSSRRNSEGDFMTVKVNKDYIQNKFLKSINSYFSESILYRLKPESKIQFNTDTKRNKYVYYRNGFVTISKDGQSFKKDYSLLKNHIWENQILDRNFNPNQAENYHQSEYFKFCFNVANQNVKRLHALQTIIGYALHHYTEYKLKATILTDAQMSLEGEANGRTGKGIFVDGLGYMLNNKRNDDAKVYCQINGKGFDFNEKHRYQKADINTKLIHIEDVKAYFYIDNMFNDITEGVEVDKKNEKPFNIHPKFILSTNKSIRINGDSAKDRVVQFEFAEHYSKDHSPEDDFGHWLFTEWDTKEWELFDVFMIESIYQFFKNELTIIEPEAINLNRRALIEHTSQEFINYMDFYSFSDKDHDNETAIGTYIVPIDEREKEYSKKDLYNDFVESYPDFAKHKRFSQSKFTSWLRAYAENSELLQPINQQQDERRSNGIDYIVFRRK